MELKDIYLSNLTRSVLEENGRLDAEHEVSIADGWHEVAKLGGFDEFSRTPAFEAYLNGYYSYVKEVS